MNIYSRENIKFSLIRIASSKWNKFWILIQNETFK